MSEQSNNMNPIQETSGWMLWMLVASVCMCKFLGTSFGIDCISVLRKTLGARALQEGAWCHRVMMNQS